MISGLRADFATRYSTATKLSLGGASAGTGKHLVVGDLIPNFTGSELQLADDKMYLLVKDRGLCVGVTKKLVFSPRLSRVSKNCPLHVSAMGHKILYNLGRVLELDRRHWRRRDRLAPHLRLTE